MRYAGSKARNANRFSLPGNYVRSGHVWSLLAVSSATVRKAVIRFRERINKNGHFQTFSLCLRRSLLMLWEVIENLEPWCLRANERVKYRFDARVIVERSNGHCIHLAAKFRHWTTTLTTKRRFIARLDCVCSDQRFARQPPEALRRGQQRCRMSCSGRLATP